MLQWMGGSRRKLTTSRKSTQNRQKQYFEQRKRRQQQTSGFENFHDVANTESERHKEHRSLDILSLLNLSTSTPDNKNTCASDFNTSMVQSHFKKNPAPTLLNIEKLEESAEFVDKRPTSCHEGETLSAMKNKQNDSDTHTNTKNDVDSKADQGKASVEQNLSIFYLLCDDGMIGNPIESSTKEAHVAFSVEGLGRVGMETPACSPEHTGRSFSYGFSPTQKAARPWNSSESINVWDDLELEVDMMMQNTNEPHDDSSLKYSMGMMDMCESPNKKSPAKTSFQFVEDCNRNNYYGRKSIFDGMDGGRERWDGGFSFSDKDFHGERGCNFFEKNHSNRIDNDATEFLKYGMYDISENASESPYLPKKRGASRTMDEFEFFEPAKSSLKHPASGHDYGLMFDTERNSRAVRISNFEDRPLRPDWFCSVEDDATDTFSLLSEESCSSSAVRGEAFNSTPLNSNLTQSMRRGRDVGSGPANSYNVNSIYSREPCFKISDEVNQENRAHGPGKYAQKSNSSKFKPFHSNPPFVETSWPSISRSFDKECNLSSLYQSPATDLPFRGSMPFTGPAFPASSFTNKQGETVAHPSSGPISKRFAVQTSNVESLVIEPDLCPSSKLVGMYPDMAEATSSHGGDTPSPVMSAQESVAKEENESKFPPTGSENGFQEEICIGNNEACTNNREWLDASNYENENCDSMRNEEQNESPATENLETSAEEPQPSSVKIPDKTGNADENKYNHDDKIAVPCTEGVKEVKEIKLQGRKTGGKNCSIDSSSQVMMLESYVLQLLFVQKVLKQTSAQDYMKNT